MRARALIVRPAAEREAQEAAQWYEAESPGLGAAFLEVVDRTLGQIVDNPRRFPLVFRTTRRALLKRFPYGIFFRVTNGRAVVIAILHLARHPSRWQRRR